jgi:hypothetical protein
MGSFSRKKLPVHHYMPSILYNNLFLLIDLSKQVQQVPDGPMILFQQIQNNIDLL